MSPRGVRRYHLIVDHPEPTDDLLLQAWRDGDKVAGQRLVERHYQAVARFFLHKLGPQTDDLVQATFLGLIEGIERFRSEGSFRAFLFAIARNKLLKQLRNTTRDRARFDAGETSLAGLDPSPTHLLVAQAESKLLLNALRHLPIDSQIMLELHYWERMAIADIAVVFDMKVNTVKARMRRARIALDEHMQALAATPQELEATRSGLSGWAQRLRNELEQR